MSDHAVTTAEQLFELDEPGWRYELVLGELRRMTPAGPEHGAIAARIARRVGNYIEEHDLGESFGAETGFVLERGPDTVRAPDYAFVRASRLPRTYERGFFPGPPDLAVELVSPNDRFTDVDEKAAGWLSAGAQLVWVLNPRKRSVHEYCCTGEGRYLTADDTIDGRDVLPSFSMQVADLFPKTN